ncbi:MAG: DNA translocase FtsK [Patescibacteria group bacterium]|nr:DNA translocase FtsK [Patescibacteria group bacterium]
MKRIRRAKLRKLTPPKVIARNEVGNTEFAGFPLDHYSYSSFTKFSTNPLMFKVNYLNGDQIETTSSPTNVIGKAVHKALGAYLGGEETPPPSDEGEAIKFGHSAGIDYLKGYSDGFIEYNDRIKNRAKLDEKFAFAFFGYIKESNLKKNIKEILLVEKMLQHKVEVDGKVLPIPLKGSADLVYRDLEDRIIIWDHKFTERFSNPDAIDGAKLIQAATNYLLVHAELNEAPHAMVFTEYKITENQDKSPQIREYWIVFDQHPLVFQFFYRFYEDITNALLGRQVYVPNLYAIFDREVAILAYIHRLDVDEERDKAFKKLKVDNITDFLKKKIEKDGAMKRYLETVSQKFISAKTLNYKAMTVEERIKMKLAEHGLSVDFHSKVVGCSVVQYRFEPSIGLKMSKIESYVKDIEQVVEVSGIRILAPIPDTGLVGFEVPNKERTYPATAPNVRGYEIPVGVDLLGEALYLDLREAPHVLIAGATGSGKSVCMTNIIKNALSLPKSQVHLIDPKMVELAPFAKEAASYNHDPKMILDLLKELVDGMNARYAKMQEAGVRNIKDFKRTMPYQFVFIDEFADLIMTSRQLKARSKAKNSANKIIAREAKKLDPTLARKKMKEIQTDVEEVTEFSCEDLLMLLAQKGRAAGIHIVMATQRPSVDVINGSIKANFPTRIAFRTSTAIDSQVIIDQAGAEKLLGKGDMLLLDPSRIGLQRLQGFNA